MPRNVGGVFSLPAGTAAVPNALNSSADVNSRFADLEAEQNLVRPVSAGGTGGANQADARAGLGLVIGTNVQAQNANLQAEAGLTGVADRVAYFTGAGAKALATLTAFGRTLIGGADATAVRTAIGAQPLDATLTSLAADMDFLVKGDVFSADQIDAYIELKWEEVMRWETTPSAVEFDMYYSM